MIITPTLHCCCRRRAHDGEWRRRRHRHRRRYRQWLRARPPTLCRELGDPRPTPRNHHATPAPARPLGRAAAKTANFTASQSESSIMPGHHCKHEVRVRGPPQCGVLTAAGTAPPAAAAEQPDSVRLRPSPPSGGGAGAGLPSL